MNRFVPHLLSGLILTLSLAGCSNAKETLGLNKPAPDEFAVVKRAPLEMPPNYSLRPPQPGAPRPQEMETSQTAQRAVFGEYSAPAGSYGSAGEAALLQQAGATQPNPDIRHLVDSETTEVDMSKKPVIDRLMGNTSEGQDATVVDAEKEAERLKKNAEEGKPVTEGETPSIEQ